MTIKVYIKKDVINKWYAGYTSIKIPYLINDELIFITVLVTYELVVMECHSCVNHLSEWYSIDTTVAINGNLIIFVFFRGKQF